MKALVFGGTRFFGVHLVNTLIANGHQVFVATRGRVKDNFGDSVTRIICDRSDPVSIRQNFGSEYFDVICDSLAYCSKDIRNLLDNVNCGRYVTISTTAVYHKHIDTKESEFDYKTYPLKWCLRSDFPYDEAKRQAECALFQKYSFISSAAVRFPFGIGCDDYTQRLYFYVEHTVKGIPMFIDNIDNKMGFVDSKEAGQFLAFMAEQKYTGAINGCSKGMMSIREILTYVENKTGCNAILDDNGDAAPYNGEVEYSINTDKAAELGFVFSELNSWIHDLLDYYIQEALKTKV
jgi:nucleoside-diphosphate-sugar epimerase